VAEQPEAPLPAATRDRPLPTEEQVPAQPEPRPDLGPQALQRAVRHLAQEPFREQRAPRQVLHQELVPEPVLPHPPSSKKSRSSSSKFKRSRRKSRLSNQCLR
jgi:hypothetical protein